MFIYFFFALASIPLSEKKALVNLYYATDGEHWKRPWVLNTPVETWYGITISDGHVIALNLPSNNLRGELPASISELRYLRVLNLASNRLGGTLPRSIGELRDLTSLELF
ncbi:hypothetical protein [Formosa haliotis]|uniref:hypothetical protein n=1 Tax=Formosa haliotis TaxID=1555194 RepID=UPI000824738B|nr:hypothetical protein [Formosa haliotis]